MYSYEYIIGNFIDINPENMFVANKLNRNRNYDIIGLIENTVHLEEKQDLRQSMKLTVT
jgi:hypothetical protein